MSKNYKKTMDKITVDDEMRKRILNNIDSIKQENTKDKFKKKSYRSLGTLAAAACFSIIVFSVNVKMSLNDKMKMSLNDNKEISFNQTKDNSNESSNVNDTDADTYENNEKNLELGEETSSEKTKDNYNKTSASNNSISNNVSNNNAINKSSNNTKKEIHQEKKNEQKTETNIKEDSLNNSEPPTMQVVYDNNYTDSKSKVVENAETLNKNLEELQSNVGFSIKTPQEVIENKDIKNINLKENNKILISYENSDVKLDFEVKKEVSKEDKINDSKYKTEKNISINDKIVSLKGNDNLINTANWSDDDLSYSINSNDGISEDKAMKIIESVK
ncbi:hypothetical protein FDE76_16020 [Clostridium botulinum]|uniref:DUF4367 domain-containing protein n=1 Tax=Clostridium botulinum (strain Eklund 17B / Type B) TaxID=935198 RepID=B2TRY8_CLOBB|nr:conserved hypothetical protein [Clostridium botulinum B str. Eklund 17B (NRP)]MBN1055650.1 hypothetical protein [Clostridium botulinum]MBY6976847.1 hypothetical protein [Clostridium botulinum]MBY7002025.1 hypothetical protein [Clostridium botulinum]MCR1272922.1 hypothetical protein [Clostridium botulinum]